MVLSSNVVYNISVIMIIVTFYMLSYSAEKKYSDLWPDKQKNLVACLSKIRE